MSPPVPWIPSLPMNCSVFSRDGEVFHQLYRGEESDELFYQKIVDTLTLLARGGERA